MRFRLLPPPNASFKVSERQRPPHVNRLQRPRGYILLTLLFILVGVSALYFASKPTDTILAIWNNDFKKLEEVKQLILQRAITKKGALDLASVFSGMNDYPGLMPCPENTASNFIGGIKEGSEKPICKDSAVENNYQGRLAWRMLGLKDNTDSAGSQYWYIFNQQYGDINSSNFNRSFSASPKMYWADDGVNFGEEIVALLFSPQKILAGQVRKDIYLPTDPLPNAVDFLEIVRDTTSVANSIIIRRRTDLCINASLCSAGVLSNDFVVAITKKEWLLAVESRVANTVLACMTSFPSSSSLPSSPSLPSFMNSDNFTKLDKTAPTPSIFNYSKSDICENIFNRLPTPSLPSSINYIKVYQPLDDTKSKRVCCTNTSPPSSFCYSADIEANLAPSADMVNQLFPSSPSSNFNCTPSVDCSSGSQTKISCRDERWMSQWADQTYYFYPENGNQAKICYSENGCTFASAIVWVSAGTPVSHPLNYDCKAINNTAPASSYPYIEIGTDKYCPDVNDQIAFKPL